MASLHYHKRITVFITIALIFGGCTSEQVSSSLVFTLPPASETQFIPTASVGLTSIIIPVQMSDTFVPSVSIITDACTPSCSPAVDIIAPTDQPQIQPTLESAPAQLAPRPIFDQFVENVKNGNIEQIVGVYVEDVLGLRVVQQPPDQPAFVSPINGVATQFIMAFEVAGNIGLLAHNYLSGQYFFFLIPGTIVQLIYGDGNVTEYEVATIYQYQALNPTSPTSDFRDLDTGDTITASTLFNLMYMGEHHLTFQTCIAQDGDDSWGRLFVIAYPF